MGNPQTVYLSDKIKAMKASEDKEAWLTLHGKRLRIVPYENLEYVPYTNTEVLIKNRGNIWRAIVMDKDGLHFMFTNGAVITGQEKQILAGIAEEHDRPKSKGA